MRRRIYIIAITVFANLAVALPALATDAFHR